MLKESQKQNKCLYNNLISLGYALPGGVMVNLMIFSESLVVGTFGLLLLLVIGF